MPTHTLSHHVQDLQTRVQDLRGKALQSRSKAEEARASQVANTSQNNVLDSLTRLKNSGRISGFHVSLDIANHFVWLFIIDRVD
jgi:hypothetical protein